MKFSTVAQAISASTWGPDNTITNVKTDSRLILPGDCFVAIKGERRDGHDFIEEAINRGAVGIIASASPSASMKEKVSYLQVDNTITALGRLASFWRKCFPIPLVGITGSCGKTTVKDMIYSICQRMGKTLATDGNYNNHIGLPLTLLRLDESYRYAVIEMGASAKGEIDYLGNIAKPTVSLITNVAPAHLEGFGSLFGVAEAKGEIYRTLSRDGVAILNSEEAYGDFWRSCIEERKTITFGLHARANVYASEMEEHSSGIKFTLHLSEETRQVCMKIPGKHTVLNALASASVAHALWIPIDQIVLGLEAFGGVPGRLCRVVGIKGANIIDDTYNANPGSMAAALGVLATHSGPTIFVMGDMAELGEEAAEYHIKVGKEAREKGISQLFAVGKWSEQAAKAFGQGASWYPTQTALIAALRDNITPETVILVKGSRSSQMEKVTQAIIQREE